MDHCSNPISNLCSLYMRAVNAIARLYACANLSEPFRVTFLINLQISWVCSYNDYTKIDLIHFLL